MAKEYLKVGAKVLSMDTDGNTTSLEEAVNTLAMIIYDELKEYRDCKDKDEKSERKEELSFLSNILNSLSSAHYSTKH